MCDEDGYGIESRVNIIDHLMCSYTSDLEGHIGVAGTARENTE